MFEGEKKETIRVLRDSIFYNKVETTTFYFLYHKRNNESSSRLQIILLPIIDVNTISAPNVSFCFFWIVDISYYIPVFIFLNFQ